MGLTIKPPPLEKILRCAEALVKTEHAIKPSLGKIKRLPLFEEEGRLFDSIPTAGVRSRPKPKPKPQKLKIPLFLGTGPPVLVEVPDTEKLWEFLSRIAECMED